MGMYGNIATNPIYTIIKNKYKFFKRLKITRDAENVKKRKFLHIVGGKINTFIMQKI
jgi:hypothetical protein